LAKAWGASRSASSTTRLRSGGKPRSATSALKTSFKLAANPFKHPKTADEWDAYLAENRREVERLTRELAAAENEINHRVYRLFQLTEGEIKLLDREVEH